MSLIVPALLFGLVGVIASRKGRGASAGGIWSSLPERLFADETQERLLNELALRGNLEWHLVTESRRLPDGTTAAVTVPVTNAIKLDGVRVSNLLYPNAQRLADRLGLLLPTTRIADMVHRAAIVQFKPQSDPMQRFVQAGTNTSKSSTLEHSRLVDEAVAGREGLADNEGKWFVLSKSHWDRPNRSGTYGWWRDGKIVHGLEHLLAHGLRFADYSQVLRLVGPTSVIQPAGQAPFEADTADVYTSPQWSALLSAEGPLPGSRHPGVEAVA